MVEDENSMDDNDPIDVNKFLASDGIRIKEERTFEESFAEYEQVNTRVPHSQHSIFIVTCESAQ
jgi:hypothetical protein